MRPSRRRAGLHPRLGRTRPRGLSEGPPKGLSVEMRPVVTGTRMARRSPQPRVRRLPVPAVLERLAAGSFYMDETESHRLFVCRVRGREAGQLLSGGAPRPRASIRGEGDGPLLAAGLGDRVLRRHWKRWRCRCAHVGLEVLEETRQPGRLYAGHGFQRRRRLLGYTLRRPRAPASEGVSRTLTAMETSEAVAMLEHGTGRTRRGSSRRGRSLICPHTRWTATWW